MEISDADANSQAREIEMAKKGEIESLTQRLGGAKLVLGSGCRRRFRA